MTMMEDEIARDGEREKLENLDLDVRLSASSQSRLVSRIATKSCCR
jgi:hypothetical protein